MTQTILGNILHPEYSYMSQRWREWRLCYESGQFYIENYLIWFKYEKREKYQERKSMTYVPAFAKEGINEIRNAVWGRLNDVRRDGGDKSYQAAIVGDVGGVDRRRSSMSDFLGKYILPEMLTMRRVGVWVDMPQLMVGETKATAARKHPYLCWYPVESIRSWQTDDEGKLTRILLKQSNFGHDEATGLPMSTNVDSFRYAWLGDPLKGEDPRVHVREESGIDEEKKTREYLLDLDEIPFVQAEIEHSLLEDVCGHQRALLNMESSDVAWVLNANFPIWTMQVDSKSQSNAIRQAQQQGKPPLPRPGTDMMSTTSMPIVPAVPAGQAKEASEAKAVEVTTGPTTGISYPAGLDRPEFVSPSAEPLTASMAKEMQIKEDIRRILHLSVATLDPRMASAESKDMDDRGLQNGLTAIGAALQRLEQAIAHFWVGYMGGEKAKVQYPLEWSMLTEGERRKDAKELIELRDEVPSIAFRKSIAKQVAIKLIGHRVSQAVMSEILSEIDDAQYVTANVDDVASDIENGVVSKATASKIRGYAASEADKALAEQGEQLKMTAMAQTPGQGAGAAATDPARGGVGRPGDTGSKDEKAAHAKSTGVTKDNTRGEGK